MKNALAIVPKLKSGDDAAIAAQLTEKFNQAQNGMRRIIALGLFAWEIKETQLKHGQWGHWLAAHAPDLCRPDSLTGKPKASGALTNYMDLTRGVLENVGFKTVGKYLGAAAKFPRDGNLSHGDFLLIEDKNVPADVKPIREKIFDLVDGKTQKQLFLEFKQAEEDETGAAKPHRGQLKGSKGLTKEMRERAAERQEAARIGELEEDTKATVKFLLENSDAKNFGVLDPKTLAKLSEALETAQAFIKRLAESRK
jgi:hypothetical protein